VAEAAVGLVKAFQLLALGALHIYLQSPETLLHLNDGPLHLQKLVVYGPAAVQILVLGQIAQGFSLGNDYGTLVRRQLSYDNFQKSRFSGSVNTYDGRLFPLFYVKGYVI